MKGNEDECHLVISTDKTVLLNLCIIHKNNSKYEQPLGIKIDWKLRLENRIRNICKKAGAKLNASTRVAQNMNTEKCLIRNFFFRCNLTIVPLTWLFHNRLLNHKIDRLHERFRCVIYNVIHSSDYEWLNLDSSVSIHH